MTYLTAKPRPKLSVRNNTVCGGLLNHEALSIQELQKNKKKTFAFCQTPGCFGTRLYHVKGLSGLAVRVKYNEEGECVNCGIYVFFSNRYSEPLEYREYYDLLNSKEKEAVDQKKYDRSKKYYNRNRR